MSAAVEVLQILGPLFGLLIVTGTIGYLAYTAVEVVRRRVLGVGSPAEEEVEELRHRMAELEERLDFAERLLSSEDNRARLPEPSNEVSAESGR